MDIGRIVQALIIPEKSHILGNNQGNSVLY
ncbi:MAG: hypothetical protein K0R54_4124 [Clostridiaceae bacterium]|nr:hypothetical protein [Clostridiaceae bacterium]